MHCLLLALAWITFPGWFLDQDPSTITLADDLSAFTQAKTEEEIRTLAWKINQSESVPTSLWPTVNDPNKLAFLEACNRVYGATDEIDALCQLAFASDDQDIRNKAIKLANFHGISKGNISKLINYLDNKDLTIASNAAFSLISSGNCGADTWPKRHLKLLDAVNTSMLEQGVTPHHGLAALFKLLPEASSRHLFNLCETQINKNELGPLASLLNSDGFNYDQDGLLSVLLLNNEAHPQPSQALRQIWLRASSAEVPPKLLSVYLRTLERHAKFVSEDTLFPMPHIKSNLQAVNWLFTQAPLHACANMLHSVAMENGDESNRSKAILRLLRGNGEEWTSKLLPLLDQEPSPRIKNAIMSGIRPYFEARDIDLIARNLPKMRQQSAGIGLELLLLYGTTEQRQEYIGRIPRIDSSAAQIACVKAIWDSDPSPLFIQTFTSWLDVNKASVQAIGRWALTYSMSASECAEVYRQKIFACQDSVVLSFLLANLWQLKTEESLPVILDWLATPDGLRHADSTKHAMGLMGEKSAQGLFLRWWQQRDSLTSTQLLVTAAALSPSNPQARNIVYENYEALDKNLEIGVLDRLKEGAVQRDFEIWYEHFISQNTSGTARKFLSQNLVANLPASRDHCFALLDELNLRHTELTSHRDWQRLLTVFMATDYEQLARTSLELSLELAEENPTAASELRRARLLAWNLNANFIVQDVLLDDLTDLLSQTSISSTASTSSIIQSHAPLLATLTLASNHLNNYEYALNRILISLGPNKLSDDVLYVIASNKEPSIPGSAKQLARELLSTTSPRNSIFRGLLHSNKDYLEPKLWTNQGETFKFLAEHLLNKDLPFDPSTTLNLVRSRWPQDHRSYSYSGWYLLRSGNDSDLNLAREMFTRAIPRLGSFPNADREPRLGIAIIDSLLKHEDLLSQHLESDPESAKLLYARILKGISPELDRLIK